MYTLLIVEDEPLERVLLEDILEKNFSSIIEITSTDNGVDALRHIQKEQPDIVLVDINIPGISGLDLMRELSEHHFEGQILITTAYNSFEYAKKAMQYGAMGYLLKPILDGELLEYLKKCFKNIEDSRCRRHLEKQLSEGMVSICSYAQQYLIRDFFQGNVQENAMRNAYGWAQNGKLQARILRIHFEKELTQGEENQVVLYFQDSYQSLYRTLIGFEENDCYLMIQPEKPQEEDFLKLTAWGFALSVSRLMWKKLPTYWMEATKICRTYQEMWEELPDLQIKRRERPSSYQEAVGFEPMDFRSIYTRKEQQIRFQKAVWRLKEGRPDKAAAVFHAYFEQEDTVYRGIFWVMQALLSYDENIDIADGILAVNREEPLKSLKKWLEDVFLDLNTVGGAENKHSFLMEQALEIMKEEYASPELSQVTLAERLGLNPAYFSRLFKKEMGEKFVQAMTKIRMEQAKAFLDQGKSLEETAHCCGYSNRKYFSEAFKAYFGKTITGYQREGMVK